MTVSAAPPESPYVGPRPIPANRTLYGRDYEVRRLLNTLIPERIVLLYSPSGAGKTSLIQAALVPALRERDLLVRRPIRVNLDPGLLPELGAESRPVNRYVLSTLLSLDEELPDGQRRTPDELAQLDLVTYLEQTAPVGEQRRPEVLIFDQFEEIITLDPVDLAAKEEFFRQLGAALQDPWRWALFAMREDYIAALDPYVPLLPTRLRARFRLDLLAERAARQAIQQPAADAGYTITDDAVDKLVGDLLEVRLAQPGGGPPIAARGHYVEPVQLQVVCLRIWNQLAPGTRTIDLSAIEQWGNVDTALGDYYTDSIQKIARETVTPERRIRDWIEEQLTTPDGMRFQVVEGAGQTEGLPNVVLTALEHAHLVRREHHRGIRWYELTHDRLVRAARESNAAWREENLTLLEREAAVWNQHGRLDHLLVRGAALGEMERLAVENPEIVREVERAFLIECRQQRDAEARKTELEETLRQLHEAERQQEAAHLREELAAADVARAQSQAAQAAAEALQAEIETNRVRLKFRLILALVLVAIGGAAVALTLGGFTFYFRGESEDRERVGTARLLATQVEPQLHRYDLAMLLAVQAHRLDDSPQTRGSLLTAVADNPRLVQYLRGHWGTVASVAFSPDGRYIATGSPVGEDGAQTAGEVIVWDAREGHPVGVRLLGHERGLSFSPDGRLLASGRVDGSISLWDITETPARGTVTLAGAHSRPVKAVAFAADGRLLASASMDGSVAVWDISRPEQPRVRYEVDSATGREKRPEAWGVAINSATGLVATGTEDGQVVVWNLATGRRQHLFRPNGDWERAVAFTPTGDRILAAGVGGVVRSWDTQSGTLVSELPTESRNTVMSLAVSPDGQRLAAAGVDGRTTVWDLAPSPSIRRSSPATVAAADQLLRAGLIGPVRLPPLLAHTNWAWSVAFGPDSRTLVTGSLDRTAIVWNLDARWGRPISREGPPLYRVAIDPSNTVVAAAGEEGVIRVWTIDDGRLMAELRGGHQGQVRSLVFSPDGTTLVSGGNDRAVVFWDWRNTAQPVRSRRSEHLGNVIGLALSQDGGTLASVSCGETCNDSQVLIWDATSETVQRQLGVRDLAGPTSLALSPDGRKVVVGLGFARISLWKLDGDPAGSAPPGGPTADLVGRGGHNGEVRGLAFSADGDTLASSSTDGRVILWDVATRMPLSESLVGTGRTVWDVTYQPDGMLLAIANGDGTVSLRDAQSADRIGPFLRDHGDGARSVAFSPDGAVLASTGLDGRVILWDTSSDAWEARVCRVANRNLSPSEWRKYLGERAYQKTCPDLPDGEDPPSDAND